MTSIIWTILLFLAVNLTWELIQFPLYTLWSTGTPREIAFALIHCTAGDVLIGTGAWAASRLLLARLPPARRSDRAFLTRFLTLAVAYTAFSEWVNVHFMKNWAYTELMPLVPPFGTGLTPLLQWIIVPILTWLAAGDRVRSKLAGRPADLGGNAP